MSDQINNFENDQGRSAKVLIHERMPVHKGYEGRKLFVYAEISSDGKRARKIPMFLKTEEDRDEDIYNLGLENILANYKRLKDLGFPVVPTFRIDKENKRILMTDVSEHGRKRIIDLHEHDSVPHFSNSKELRNTIRKLSKKAYKNGILLSTSAFAIVTDRKTKHGEVYLLDLGETYTIEEYRKKVSENRDDKITQTDIDQYLKNETEGFVEMCIGYK